ncbi:hypothetical protein CDAR_523591 [Caerostris darwini]|uniref:Uncharacterized protein n=1 Tax=Caerostris darwini TaxID=1538125 RepID=A0AAV4UNK4_9ARAC|nr:hypothetical protein CDAR_523591 [Caerostris darwini]
MKDSLKQPDGSLNELLQVQKTSATNFLPTLLPTLRATLPTTLHPFDFFEAFFSSFGLLKGDLPHFKSPDNVGRRRQESDKEISSYHLNLQSEGS